jgi:hypothetical protein
MRVFWWQAGLHIEPEGEEDVMRITAIEATIRALEGVRIFQEDHKCGFSSSGLLHTLAGSDSNNR